MRFLIFLISAAACFNTTANEHKIFLGFGELPILANSLKPSLGYVYDFGAVELSINLQFKDTLNRNNESYNANFGQHGLESSKEQTKNRYMIQGRFPIYTSKFYLSLGLIYGGNDIEKIIFNHRQRLIGNDEYLTSLNVNIERKARLKPALGLGISYPITHQWRFISDFTMAWYGNIPKPKVTIRSSASLAPSDTNALVQDIQHNYRTNFHNRYHVFNLGVEYFFNL